MSKHYDITVFIPTYFGEKYLDNLLHMVFKQKIDKTFEVLIYDTSSKDRTPQIIKKYAKKHDNLRWKTITKAEFGHGKTRAAAAHDAKGDIVVYLSQDATPQTPTWLYELVKPFELHEKIVGVFGKQIAWPTAPPVLKYDIRASFNSFCNDASTAISYKDNFMKTEQQLDMVSFYSDVNSAARRSILTGEIPYRDVPYAEDLLFGRDIIKAGYFKAYASRGAVVHSNDIKLSEMKSRVIDETAGKRMAGIEVDLIPRRLMIKVIIRSIILDMVRTIFDREYSWKRKLLWLALNPFYVIEKWRGVRLGAMLDLSDEKWQKKYSLEAKQKIKHERQ